MPLRNGTDAKIEIGYNIKVRNREVELCVQVSGIRMETAFWGWIIGQCYRDNPQGAPLELDLTDENFVFPYSDVSEIVEIMRIKPKEEPPSNKHFVRYILKNGRRQVRHLLILVANKSSLFSGQVRTAVPITCARVTHIAFNARRFIASIVFGRVPRTLARNSRTIMPRLLRKSLRMGFLLLCETDRSLLSLCAAFLLSSVLFRYLA